MGTQIVFHNGSRGRAPRVRGAAASRPTRPARSASCCSSPRRSSGRCSDRGAGHGAARRRPATSRRRSPRWATARSPRPAATPSSARSPSAPTRTILESEGPPAEDPNAGPPHFTQGMAAEITVGSTVGRTTPTAVRPHRPGRAGSVRATSTTTREGSRPQRVPTARALTPARRRRHVDGAVAGADRARVVRTPAAHVAGGAA